MAQGFGFSMKIRGFTGRKQLWPEKGRGKGNSFSFSENIFVKKNNLVIAR
jgi:hypothetical protein